MRIDELIQLMKHNAQSFYLGQKLTEETSRDQILYGDSMQECTGIVTTCYASADVIRKAGELGCNFIVVHEALFWNHGDHTDWLSNNTAFQKKKSLLDQYGICIWRNHDHIHAGIPVDGEIRDGIFYGMSTLMGWNDYLMDKSAMLPQYYEIPEMTVTEMAKLLNDKFHLKGVRFIGNPDCRIRKVYMPLHIMGRSSDNELISKIDQEDIHCLLTLEMVDFTVCEYVRDAAMLGENRCIFALGHFNLEEIGMEYYAQYLRDNLVDSIPVHFIQSGDAYSYISAKK